MSTLAEDAFDRPPTPDERRLMEGMMAEWHAADLADVGVYEDREGPNLAQHVVPPKNGETHMGPLIKRDKRGVI